MRSTSKVGSLPFGICKILRNFVVRGMLALRLRREAPYKDITWKIPTSASPEPRVLLSARIRCTIRETPAARDLFRSRHPVPTRASPAREKTAIVRHENHRALEFFERIDQH